MKKRRLFLLVVIIVFAGTMFLSSFKSFVRPEPPILIDLMARAGSMPPVPGQVRRDLVYRRHLFSTKALDLYEPLVTYDQGRAPLVVFFHGGSWMYGDKVTIRIIDRFLSRMRRAGYFIASVNYVTDIFTGFGGSVKNGTAAVNWLRDNAGEYGFDPDNIGLYGISAGGHVALMAEVALRTEKCISLVLAECAPSDLEAMADGEAFGSSDTLSILPDSYLKRYSPTSYVSSDMSPVLIYHGDADSIVHVDQAKRLAKRIEDAGGHVELEIYENGIHAFLGMPDSLWYRQETRALKFMAEFFLADIPDSTL